MEPKIICCKQCTTPKRHPGCHATCEEYLSQKCERDKYLDAVYANKNKESKLTHSIIAIRSRRNKGRKNVYDIKSTGNPRNKNNSEV